MRTITLSNMQLETALGNRHLMTFCELEVLEDNKTKRQKGQLTLNIDVT